MSSWWVGLISIYDLIKRSYPDTIKNHLLTAHLNLFLSNPNLIYPAFDSLLTDFKSICTNNLYVRFLDSAYNKKKNEVIKKYHLDDAMSSKIVALMYSQNGIVNYNKHEFDLLKKKFMNDKPVLMQIKINENLQDHPLNTNPKPANGTYLANFRLPDKNGKDISLSTFKGKYVLIDFWASWCGPCRKESPYLKQAVSLFGKNNFVVLSISIDENRVEWKKAIIADRTQKFIHLIDITGRKSLITKQYNIDSIPSNFLIDPTGKVLDSDLRGPKLLVRLKEVIPNSTVEIN